MCDSSICGFTRLSCSVARAIPDRGAQQVANVCDAFSEGKSIAEKVQSLAILALLIAR